MSAYTFLSLVNDINGRLNEVPLTSATFPSATGFYTQAKSGINSALREIYQDAFEWPFTHVTRTDTLVVNQTRYAPPADLKILNLDSFRLKGDDTLNVSTHKLAILDYEEYIEKYSDADFNPEKSAGVPRYVFRTPELGYGVYPAPDKAYDVVYEYNRVPVDLELYSDVPALPEQFKHMIVDGAMHDCFIFRGDPEGAAAIWQKFQERIKDVRKIYQNRFEYVRSAMIEQNQNRGQGYYR